MNGVFYAAHTEILKGEQLFMRMNMFAVYNKAKPDTENIRRLNLAVVELKVVQVTKLPL
jgi:hypothetical protein